MRSAYHYQLDALTALLGEMCRRAGVAMEGATQALLHADLVVAERVISEHDRTTAINTAVQDRAIVLLALHVAKVARRRHPKHALPEDVNGYFAEMGHLAVGLSNSAAEVLLSGDPEHAARMDEEDDGMDDLHRHLFTVLMDREWIHGVAAAVDVTLLGRFYERFADHAVAIAHRVIFQATMDRAPFRNHVGIGCGSSFRCHSSSLVGGPVVTRAV